MTQRDLSDAGKNWRRHWLACIHEFGDIEMQRATWLNPYNVGRHRNPHYSFQEFTACYFDDLGLFQAQPDSGAKHCDLEPLSAEEAAAVAPFHDLLQAYVPPNRDPLDDQAILRDPKWQEVAAAAASARYALALIIDDPDELRALSVRSVHADLAAAKTYWARLFVRLKVLLSRTSIS